MSIPKGAYSGECNRGACQQKPANYWNPHTERFYCVHCARKINEWLAKDGLRLIERLPDHVGAQRSE